MSKKLLASAPTLEGIQDSISRFYCGCEKTLVPERACAKLTPAEVCEWSVWSPRDTGNIRLSGVRVIKLNNRYRFEMTS